LFMEVVEAVLIPSRVAVATLRDSARGSPQDAAKLALQR